MKIIADENIPLVNELFAPLGEVILLPGRKISHREVADADILLVRSVTQVNEALLADSKVKFVGTATTGIDHVDTAWLEKNHIAFADAKGANAQAVAEYVICCIANLQQRGLLPKKALSAGIIGVGHVGSNVALLLKRLGFHVLLNDPPRAEQEKNFVSTPLEKFIDVDLVCLHTPLTLNGSFPTYHLIEKNFLQQLKLGCVLLNAGRGAVINSSDLLQYGRHLIWCLDVFENEPDIDRDILKNAAIATPHIAGYTVEAKLHGALMLYQAAQKALNFPATAMTQSFFPHIGLTLSSSTSSWQDVLLQVYNPLNDTENMCKTLLNLPKEEAAHQFDYLRKHHPKRYEFASVILENTDVLKTVDKKILQHLGFEIQSFRRSD